MKRLLSLIILCCLRTGLYAQDISITFSLENGCMSDCDTLPPYLVITYSNSSDSLYYFPALAYEGCTLPIFSLGFFLGNEVPSFSQDRLNYCLHLHEGDSAFLPLDFLESKSGQALELLCYDRSINRYTNGIESYLALYYRPYYQTTENTSYNDWDYFTLEDLNNIEYLTNCPAFVFLGARGVHKQVISMSGIKEAGVILKVNIVDIYANKNVLIGITNQDIATLPPRVGDYSLYSGYFKSNELIVNFSNQARSHRRWTRRRY